jgi:hypothetical protein
MSYEHLQTHFVKDHPTLLDQFEKEWQVLPDVFRKEWTEYGERPLIHHKYSSLCIWKSWGNEIVESYHRGTLKNLDNTAIHTCCHDRNRMTENCQRHHVDYITNLIKDLATIIAPENNLRSSKALSFRKNSSNLTPQDEAIKFEESSVRKVVSSIMVYSAFEQIVVEFCERVRKDGIGYDSWPYHPHWERLLAMPNLISISFNRLLHGPIAKKK